MSDDEGKTRERETIMMALDQISQTIDVMTSVVGRLRRHLEAQENSAAEQRGELTSEAQPDRVLH